MEDYVFYQKEPIKKMIELCSDPRVNHHHRARRKTTGGLFLISQQQKWKERIEALGKAAGQRVKGCQS